MFHIAFLFSLRLVLEGIKETNLQQKQPIFHTTQRQIENHAVLAKATAFVIT